MIYLVNKETNEIIQTFEEEIITWGYNFIEYKNTMNFRTKRYCNENEYFTDEKPIIT